MPKPMKQISRLSNIKFGKFALLAIVSLSGCASQRILPSNNDLAFISPNCQIAEQQIEWLQSIRPTQKERSYARQEMFFWGGFSQNYRQNKDISTNKIDYLIDLNIQEIYYKCQYRNGV